MLKRIIIIYNDIFVIIIIITTTNTTTLFKVDNRNNIYSLYKHRKWLENVFLDT